MTQIKIHSRKFIFKADKEEYWWNSHTMAPSAIMLNKEIIRIYLGCWDKEGISRIGYIDVDSKNPEKILGKSKTPCLDIGVDGTFDENGVFPAHACVVGKNIYLYYTGFQLGHKIRHYNFGGLAISKNGKDFKRVSQSPVLDRTDEGLYVRAGQSILKENKVFRTVYSAGTGWENIGGKKRPIYDVYYQESVDGISYKKNGTLILEHNKNKEHGLGRPQIIKHKDFYLVFYTRRTLDMKYTFGCAISKDCKKWKKFDEKIEIKHRKAGDFDSKMVYFPSAIHFKENLFYIFYSGNDFGERGLGVLTVEIK